MSAADIAALKAIVGADNVLEGDLLAQRSPGYTRENLDAKLLVRPCDAGEVAAVMRLLYAAGARIVPHGGLTGLVQGAATRPGDVILSLERLKRVHRVDPVNRVMVAEAGVTLEAAQRAAAAQGLMVPLDIGARGSCTLGGNVATNAGGQRVMRYGMTRDMVLGLDVVMPDGEMLSMMPPLMKNNTGYDLKQLFIGAEGTLGIVTRVALRLHEAPQRWGTALAGCESFAQIPALLRQASRFLGGKLASFEVMDPAYYREITRLSGVAPPIATDFGSYAILEVAGFEGDDPDADLERTLARALEHGLILDAVTAKSEAERERIWFVRESSELLEKVYPACWSYDISLPLSRFESYLEGVARDLNAIEPAPDLFAFGHVADGNLHLMVGSPVAEAAARSCIEDIVYRPLPALGGSVSAEHGIGLERIDVLSLTRSTPEIALMRQIKSLLDPKGLLNPGKIFGE